MKTFYTLVIVILLNLTGFSQSYEIRARYVSGNTIAVDVRITLGTPPTTSDFITDLTFGIRWLNSYGVNLGNIIVPNPTYNVVKAGGEEVSGIYEYQAFSSALSTPFLLPENWILNEWVELIEIAHNGAGSGTGTFEIAPSSGFVMNVVPNIGISLTDFTPVINGSATNVPLPVELLQFTTASSEKAIQLEWESASEQAFLGYEVERSIDGKNFAKIAWLVGKGNEAKGAAYQYKDEAVKQNIIYYYRLKMLDLDGTFEYSPMRVASINDKSSVVRIYPNPVVNEMVVEWESKEATNTMLNLYNATGQKVMSKSLLPQDGFQKMVLDRSNLPSGVYFLHIQSNSSSYTQSVILKD